MERMPLHTYTTKKGIIMPIFLAPLLAPAIAAAAGYSTAAIVGAACGGTVLGATGTFVGIKTYQYLSKEHMDSLKKQHEQTLNQIIQSEKVVTSSYQIVKEALNSSTQEQSTLSGNIKTLLSELKKTTSIIYNLIEETGESKKIMLSNMDTLEPFLLNIITIQNKLSEAIGEFKQFNDSERASLVDINLYLKTLKQVVDTQNNEIVTLKSELFKTCSENITLKKSLQNLKNELLDLEKEAQLSYNLNSFFKQYFHRKSQGIDEQPHPSLTSPTK